MTEQRIDMNMLARIDGEQKDTASRVRKIETSLHTLEQGVSEIKGKLTSPAPWWLTYVIAPLCVAMILATTGAVVHLEVVVASMEKNVTEVRGQLATKTIATDAELPPSEFNGSLPELASAMIVARQQKLKLSTNVVDKLQQKLTSTDASTTSDFWPAAAEFINYGSFNNSSWSMTIQNYPNCVDLPPRVGTLQILSSIKATLTPAIYENCQFTIDSTNEDAYLNSILSKGTPIEFSHCIVRYRGGKVNLVLAVHLKNVPYSAITPQGIDRGTVNIDSNNTLTFADCHFLFSLPGPPLPPGQLLTQSLLASNGTIITLPLAKHS